jgi:undecaprenyl-diphosphatase
MNFSLFESILYGLVQGTTEYLPVSSSAHLLLLPKFLGKEDPGLAFDVFLHLGTLFATLLYFWRDWWALLNPKHGFRSLFQFKGITLGNLVIATIPAVLFGLLLKSHIETTFRGTGIVVITLALGGVALWAFDRFSAVKIDLTKMTQKTAILVGFFQCLSLVPGVSRSGSTMMGARLLGFNRENAARFSFLMAVPITAGAILMELRHWGDALQNQESLFPMVVAGCSSFFFGILTIHFLLGLVRRISFLGFAVYRVLFAAFVYFIFRPF